MSSPDTRSSSRIRVATCWRRPVRSATSRRATRDRPGEFLQLARNHPAPVRLGDRLAATSGQPGDTFAVLVTGRSRRHSRRGRTNRAGTRSDRAGPRIVSAPERPRGRVPPRSRPARANCRRELMTSGLGCEPRSSGTTWDDQQRVAIVDYPSTVPQDRAFHAVRQAAQNLGARPLLGSQRDAVVALTEASLSWTRFDLLLTPSSGTWPAASVVGGICQRAPDVPRSYREAQLALQLMSFGAAGASVVLLRRARRVPDPGRSPRSQHHPAVRAEVARSAP